MLDLASRALVELLYPLKWAGVFIPVLPARLLQAIEAPCPYIVGIERRYENIELPTDDYVLVDLDQNRIESTIPPVSLPRQIRRKLNYLLQMAAPHHNRFGIQPGPPAYAIEAFPFDAFSTEHPSVFQSNPPSTCLAKFAGLNSASFGDAASTFAPRPPIFNAFSMSKSLTERSGASTGRDVSPPSRSPSSDTFPSLPSTPVSRNDSGFALQATLREKRSGHFDNLSKRSTSSGMDRRSAMRRPSLPFAGAHHPSLSLSGISLDAGQKSNYAPSTYAQSTLAASTIMPTQLLQPVRNSETLFWIEGHCMALRGRDDTLVCCVCEDRTEERLHRCTGCGINAHARCAPQICLVCSSAFYPDQVRAVFVRCFASLFYTYRKFLKPPGPEQKRAGLSYHFLADGFVKSLPHETAAYVTMLQETQGRPSSLQPTLLTDASGFSEFVYEREKKLWNDPSILLFDEIIQAKRNRGKVALFGGRSNTSFLSDSTDHLWVSAIATPPSSRFPGDYRAITTRGENSFSFAFPSAPEILVCSTFWASSLSVESRDWPLAPCFSVTSF